MFIVLRPEIYSKLVFKAIEKIISWAFEAADFADNVLLAAIYSLLKPRDTV